MSVPAENGIPQSMQPSMSPVEVALTARALVMQSRSPQPADVRMRIFHNGGMPVKTKIAIAHPLLSRRERRAMLRGKTV